MKQLCSALLLFSLLLQPLVGQTTSPPTTTKSAPETPAEIIPIEDLLPADTLAYAASTNLAGVLHRFELLDAYKTAQARLPKEEKDTSDNPLAIVTRFLRFGIEDARALEDTRVGVALILPEIPAEAEAQKQAKALEPEVERRVPEPLILVFVEGVRLEDARAARKQFLAYYNETFRAIGKLSDIKQAEYKGQQVDRFQTGDIGLWFGATYVLCQPAAMDRLLTLRADRRAERLADQQEFVRTKMQMMPQTGLFAYLNGKPLQQFLGGMFGRGGGLDFLAGGSASLLGADTIKSAALASTFDRDGVMDRLLLNLSPQQTDFLSAFFGGPKGEFNATQFIPAGTEIVVSHSMDWVKIYDTLVVKMFYRELARADALRKFQLEQARKAEEARTKKQKLPDDDWKVIRQRMETELTDEKLAQATKEKEAEMDQELGFVLREEAAKDLANEVTVAYGIPKPPAVTAAKEGEAPKKNNDGWAVFIGIKDRVATQQAIVKAMSYFMGGLGRQQVSEEEENGQPKPPKTEEQRKQEREQRIKTAQSAWAMMPSEVYKKVEIKSIFAAYLGFSEEYLIVADSKETIKQMLDLADGGRTLAADFNYSRAMSNLGGASLTKLFIGPKIFDDMLSDFIKSWVANPATLETDLSLRAPLNVPATAAAAIEMENNTLKLELFTPLGIAGTVALYGFGSDVKGTTESNENRARQTLWELRKAEKLYAQKNDNQYASLAALTKAKLTVFNIEKLKDESANYKFEFKLKPDGKGYEATATPIKYGRLGRTSFFLDETDKLRAADKQGAVATVRDEMIEERVFGEEDTADENGPPRRSGARKP